LGVNSITTNNVNVVADPSRLILSIPAGAHAFVWCVVGLVCLGVFVGWVYPVIIA
jgi:hypothetical protein